ncbi:MAG: hypothetical protein H6698_09135 [Myxococcales bacterium]|nr:hypothetical protein [Myxococcales bacterium]
MHTVVDHSSVPALISRVFGLPFVNRRAELSGDFVDAFDLELTLDAARPAPPILPPLEFQMDKLRHALTLPSGQPELEAYARRHFGLDDGGFSGRMRVLERYLRQLERLRVATVRG